jgi:hypothetical protein
MPPSSGWKGSSESELAISKTSDVSVGFCFWASSRALEAASSLLPDCTAAVFATGRARCTLTQVCSTPTSVPAKPSHLEQTQHGLIPVQGVLLTIQDSSFIKVNRQQQ